MNLPKTRHGHTNYRRILPILKVVDSAENRHTRFVNDDAYMMPLSVEFLYDDSQGRPVYAMAHNTVRNGDLMCDPDMTFAIDHDTRTLEPISYQNDFLGIYQNVYKTLEDGTQLYSRRLRSSLDEFLYTWLSNIESQKYLK